MWKWEPEGSDLGSLLFFMAVHCGLPYCTGENKEAMGTTPGALTSEGTGLGPRLLIVSISNLPYFLWNLNGDLKMII